MRYTHPRLYFTLLFIVGQTARLIETKLGKRIHHDSGSVLGMSRSGQGKGQSAIGMRMEAPISDPNHSATLQFSSVQFVTLLKQNVLRGCRLT